MYGEWCLWFWHCLCVSVHLSFFHFTFQFGESWWKHVLHMEETKGISMLSLRLVGKKKTKTTETRLCFKNVLKLLSYHCSYSGNLDLNTENLNNNFWGDLYSEIKGTAMERVRRLWETWTVLKTPRYQYSNYNVNMSAFQRILLLIDILS